MRPYTEIAESYDYILRHVDYDAWYRYLRSLMEQYVEKPELVVELGCGTGRFGAKFAADRYRIIGVDIALPMLRVARMRAHGRFRVVCGDMRNLPLSCRADFVFCVHDAMNYFTDHDDLTRVFTAVKGIMGPGSIFMFDITTLYNIMNNFHDRTTHYHTRGRDITWANTYDFDKRLVHSVLTVDGPDGQRGTEEHLQRIYEIPEITGLLEGSGYEVLDVFGDYSFDPPGEKTIMINFVTRVR